MAGAAGRHGRVQVAQLKSMEDENRRLKKIYAELSLPNDLNRTGFAGGHLV